jgi:CTP:molybdopterin cytidylyltransferase MocA
MTTKATKVNSPTVIVLASGRGERFIAAGGSGSKLRALLAGKPVLERTLDAVRASGLPWHLEDAGHPGMGDSIAAAVRATPDAIGWLILPGDLPLVRPETLQAVAARSTAGSMPCSRSSWGSEAIRSPLPPDAARNSRRWRGTWARRPCCGRCAPSIRSRTSWWTTPAS